MQLNIRIGRVSALLAPGYGHCQRCRTNWRFVRYHITDYGIAEGVFALCEKCWTKLTPQERVRYYERVVIRWQRYAEVWSDIHSAVLAGR